MLTLGAFDYTFGPRFYSSRMNRMNRMNGLWPCKRTTTRKNTKRGSCGIPVHPRAHVDLEWRYTSSASILELAILLRLSSELTELEL